MTQILMSGPQLPAAPRPVSWRATAGHRSTWAAAGVALACLGVVGLAWDHGTAPRRLFDDVALDGAATRTTGQIVAAEALASAGQPVVQLTARFQAAGRQWQVSSFAAHALPGPDCVVEYLERDPSIARVQGTTRSLPARLPPNLAGSLLAVGIAVILLWVRARLDRRILLREGRAVPAESARIVAEGWGSVAVEFTFRDREQRQRHGRTTCPRHGEVARTVATGAGVFVVHQHARPERHCLTTPSAFDAQS